MGLGINVFSALTGISKGDLVKHALRFVGVPEGISAGLGALSDLKSGNFVGAFQNLNEAISGGKCASAHSCSRPSSVLGTIGKVVGFTAAGVIGANLLGGALKGTALGGLAKMMVGALGIMAAFKGVGALAGGGGATALFGNTGSPFSFQAESNMRKLFGATYTQGGPGSRVNQLPANATFEDLVSAFMIDAVKDMQEQAKAKMDEIRQSTQQGNGIMDKIKSTIGGFVGSIPVVGKAAANLLGLQNNLKQGEDSRNLMFEELKNIMQKLAQMQQAMSNVLNTMHEQAMGAIRHIKA